MNKVGFTYDCDELQYIFSINLLNTRDTWDICVTKNTINIVERGFRVACDSTLIFNTLRYFDILGLLVRSSR